MIHIPVKLDQLLSILFLKVGIGDPLFEIALGSKEKNLRISKGDPKGGTPLFDNDGFERESGKALSTVLD